MVRILVFSFLFKEEIFSFVRGLWLLDLDNRKLFLWIFFGSPLHLVFLDGDWKVFCFLAFEKFVWDLYPFSGSLSRLLEGDFNLGVFAGFPQLSWLGCALYQGVFISINAIYDFILLFFFSFCFSHNAIIWYGWRLVCMREGALASWGKTLSIELTQIFSNWSG